MGKVVCMLQATLKWWGSCVGGYLLRPGHQEANATEGTSCPTCRHAKPPRCIGRAGELHCTTCSYHKNGTGCGTPDVVITCCVLVCLFFIGLLLQASWVGFAGLGAGVGFYWWLVYDFMSWDIMEPVTYFTGAFFAIVGCVASHSHSLPTFCDERTVMLLPASMACLTPCVHCVSVFCSPQLYMVAPLVLGF